MRPRHLVLVLACLALTLPLLASPAQAATRQQLEDRAKALIFTMPLSKFIKQRNAGLKNDASPYNWDADGCSAPSGTPYKEFFRKPCLRHDFAFRNLGNGVKRTPSLALDSTESAKNASDAQLLDDMNNRCEHQASDVSNCRQWAAKYVTVLALYGSKSWWAFYKGECTPGYLCLFDDEAYHDRRKRFTVSHSDMHDFSFNDKASSVKNKTGSAWVLYDDTGYSDRSYCISAGKSVKSLKDKWDFNDKISSIKRLSRKVC